MLLCYSYVTIHSDLERCIQGFGGKPERKRPFLRPRRGWKNNNKIGLQEVEFGTYWISVSQDKDKWPELVDAVMKFWAP
jgi:hypothetical protein